MSREDEIAQGLREPSGCLSFPLDALEYSQGHKDASEGVPPPKGLTSPSYDLGRARYMREVEEREALKDILRAREIESDRRMREILPPAAYEEWRAQIEAIRSAHPTS